MQKVNVFAQLPKGGTFYKTEFCVLKTTVREILDSCNLNPLGARVYLNGAYLTEQVYAQPLSFFKVGNPVFMSVRYGEKRPEAQAVL